MLFSVQYLVDTPPPSFVSTRPRPRSDCYPPRLRRIVKASALQRSLFVALCLLVIMEINSIALALTTTTTITTLQATSQPAFTAPSSAVENLFLV